MSRWTGGVLAIVLSLLGAAVACGDDTSGPADTLTDLPEPTGALVLSVPDIPEDGTIPVEFTCDGANQVPVVQIGGVPAEAVQLALIVDDPDAPRDHPFVHWIVFGIPTSVDEITDGDSSLSYGETDAGTTSWFGPCPPEGDEPHRYRWRLFALSAPPDVDDDVDGRGLESALAGNALDSAEWAAFYGRE